MHHERLLARLREKYELIVQTQHHIQIEAAQGKHNIFLSKRGVKIQPCGQQQARDITEKELLDELERYEYCSTDLALMQQLTLILKRVEGKEGIFCDAGFSQGRARVAVIRSFNGDYDISVRLIEASDSVFAEDWAIKKAIELYPGDQPVFSDCEPAVQANQPRAKWIPRAANTAADRFGNMRGSK